MALTLTLPDWFARLFTVAMGLGIGAVLSYVITVLLGIAAYDIYMRVIMNRIARKEGWDTKGKAKGKTYLACDGCLTYHLGEACPRCPVNGKAPRPLRQPAPRS